MIAITEEGKNIALRAMVKSDVPVLYEMYLKYPFMISAGSQFGIDWLERVCQGIRKFSAGVYGYNERSLKMCRRFFGEPEATIPNEVFWNGQYFDRVWFAKYRETVQS